MLQGMYMPEIENSKNLFEYHCQAKFEKLYGDNAPEIFKSRLETEQEMILGNNYEVPYLTAKQITDKSREMGYLTSTRGGIGSSFAAFLLGITDINPLLAIIPQPTVC